MPNRRRQGRASSHSDAGESIVDSVIAFGQGLMNAELREKCETRTGFNLSWAQWKKDEAAAMRIRRGGSSEALFRLSRFPGKVRSAHGVPKVIVRGELIVFVVDSSKPSVAAAAAAERVEANRARAEANKGGIEVTPASLSFGGIVGVGGNSEQTVTVTNVSPKFQTILSVKLLLSHPSFSITFARGGVLPLELGPEASLRFVVTACPTVVGMCRDLLSISMSSSSGSHQTFSIGRFIDVRCGDAALLDLLKPSGPFVKPRRRESRGKKFDIVPAPRPDGPTSTLLSGPVLPLYNFPTDFKKDLYGGNVEQALLLGRALMQSLRGNVASAVVQTDYAEHMDGLLFAEECQLVKDLAHFDLVNERATVLTRRGGLLWLRVPGLAEKRPSVLKGDSVLVHKLGGGDKKFRGRAERIDCEEVGLKICESFNYISGQRVEVNFVLGRKPLRLFHQGLGEVKKARDGGTIARLLFPEPFDLPETDHETPRLGGDGLPMNGLLRPFNRALNAAQRAAVCEIVAAKARTVPYVVFGPPGTGKTTTLVEAVLQCARYTPQPFHILVCAPTNTAADFIASKLAASLSSRSELMRLVGYSRDFRDVPSVLTAPHNLTNWDAATAAFITPSEKTICNSTVVVATLAKAAELMNMGIPRGHFDLVVIDEGGQAFESEAIAPVACLIGEKGQLVVAGDPKQLGPVVHHRMALDYGLGTSYLERLMGREIYQKHTAAARALEAWLGGMGDDSSGSYDPRVLTKLVENYRAHETLLELPSKLFYDGDLVSRVDPMVGNSLLGWAGLPAKGVPLLWHGVQGKDDRESNSPSWFNSDEAVQVLAHVQDLLAMRNGPMAEEIGVISPYNKQCQKIRMALNSKRIEGVKVGSTELFQGQERRVIIISTVRSSDKFLDFDHRHNLGFLDNPKRFNVAVTRAQALLIVVGNPYILTSDPHWGALLQLCMEKGAYVGCPPPSAESGSGRGSGNPGGGGGSVEELAEVLGNLLLEEPSERVQQEGMEMPTYE